MEGAPGLAGAYREGLQGLKGEHRGLVACDDPRELCGSVDLDGALAAARPNDPRWDYGICHEAAGQGKWFGGSRFIPRMEIMWRKCCGSWSG